MQANRNPKRIVILFLSAALILLLLPVTAWAINRLQNDGFEDDFDKYGEWSAQGITFNLEVAKHWERFFINAGTYDNGSKLRYFRASALNILGWPTEKRDGDDAQLWWSTKPFDAGIYQQVSGLTIGEDYGFQAGILQMYANTTSKTHYKMFRSVGIDPYGGTDPTSPDVIWGPEEGLDVDWFYPGVGAQAISSTMTVFVRVRSIDDAPQYEENAVWVDDTFMDVAPATTLNLTVDSATQVTANWSGTPRSGFDLFAYEAQYREATEPDWTDLQIFTSNSNNEPSPNPSQSFAVEPGLSYVVRARTWHEQDNGDSHEVPGPWVEETITVGGLVSGKVFNNRGNSVGGITVSRSDSPATNTVTGGDGRYTLYTGSGVVGLSVTSNGSGWGIPYPINTTVPDLETIVPLSLTLRPPNDVIDNGDFENDLNGWQVSGTPAASTSQFRSGSHSLRLTDNVTISQTHFVSGTYEPTLSFWYKVDSVPPTSLAPGWRRPIALVPRLQANGDTPGCRST
jgi:hypothetical protein